jgi:8-oxo-dGTP pyrophosphatase MutT (NUDIX family)
MKPKYLTTKNKSYINSNAIPSAVLILLFKEKNIYKYYLTQRSNNVGKHKGQISLPGGSQEKNESLKSTALRETEEEIGVDKDAINIIGKLTKLYVPVSGFCIYPFVGWTNNISGIKSSDEVEKIFNVPLSDLLNKNNEKHKQKVLNNKLTKVPYFNLRNNEVWGATAMILSEFKQILESIKSN